MPADIGPPSLTSPILKFPDSTLAMSIETNKNHEDRSEWMQRVTLRHSPDMGEALECAADSVTGPHRSHFPLGPARGGCPGRAAGGVSVDLR